MAPRNQTRRFPHVRAHRARAGAIADADGTQLERQISDRYCRPREGAGKNRLSRRRTMHWRDGLPSFSQTQAASDGSHGVRLLYYAFDLLHLDGRDTASLPLIERKALLTPLIAGVPGQG